MSEDEKQESTDEEQQNEAPAEESTPEEVTQEAGESAEEAAEEQPDAPDEGETSEETPEEPAAEGEAEPEAEPEEPAEETPQPEEAAPEEPEGGAGEETEEQPAEGDPSEDEAPEEPAEAEAEDAGEQPAEEEEAPEEPPAEDEAVEEPAEAEAEPPPQGSNMGIIVGIIVLAIAIGGIIFALLRKGPSEPTKVEPTGTEPKAQEEVPKQLTKEEIAKQKAEEAKQKAQEKADAIKALVAKLDTDDFVTSSEVKDEILKYRRDAIPALAAALNAGSFNLRENAIKALAAMNLEESIRPLSMILATDKSEEVRTAAAQALGTTGNLAAVDPLIKAVADTSIDVQDAAIEGLEAITRNYKLMETDEEDGKALQKIWADWWAKNKAKLAAELAPKEKEDEPAHLHAFRTTSQMHPMAYLHPSSEEVPGGKLHGEEGSHRLMRHLATLKAADLMAAIQGDVEWLLKAVGGGDPAKLCLQVVAPKGELAHYLRGRLPLLHVNQVQTDLKAAGGKPSKATQEYLLARLKEELPTDPVLRANAARQLGEMKAKAALPLLAKCVTEDPHATVKLLAARAICKIGDAKVFQETALPYLAKAVSGGRIEDVAAAAFALGESGQKQAVEPLLGAVGDPNAEVRRRAHDGLVAITGNDSIKWDKNVTGQKLQGLWQACLKQSSAK